MGGLDGVQEFDGYDEVDEDMVFHGGRVGGGPEKESSVKERFAPSTGGRKHGKKSLAPVRSGKARKRSGFGVGFIGGIGGIDLRGFGDAASSILGIAIGAIVLSGLLLFLTFGVHILPDFYGSLAAAIIIVVLLFYIAAKLLGRNN